MIPEVTKLFPDSLPPKVRRMRNLVQSLQIASWSDAVFGKEIAARGAEIKKMLKAFDDKEIVLPEPLRDIVLPLLWVADIIADDPTHNCGIESWKLMQRYTEPFNRREVLGLFMFATEPESVPNSTTTAGPVKRRFGRLNKIESDTKRFELLAACSKHPTLMNDYRKLARDFGISKDTCRRWLNDFNKKYSGKPKQ